MQMRRLLPLILCMAITADSIASAGEVYPPPTRSRGGALTACPSLHGLQSFSRNVVRKAGAEVGRYARISRAYDLSVSDPAWQSNVRAAWKREGDRPSHGPQFVIGPSRAIATPYAGIISYSCGRAILSKTIMLVTVPGSHHMSNPPGCEACRTKFFLLDRDGHPLIYFVY